MGCVRPLRLHAPHPARAHVFVFVCVSDRHGVSGREGGREGLCCAAYVTMGGFPVATASLCDVCLSVCLAGWLAGWLSFCLSCWLSFCLSACLPACLSACLSACLPVCLPVCLSVYLSSATRTKGCMLYCLPPTCRPPDSRAGGRAPVRREDRRLAGYPGRAVAWIYL